MKPRPLSWPTISRWDWQGRPISCRGFLSYCPQLSAFCTSSKRGVKLRLVSRTQFSADLRQHFQISAGSFRNQFRCTAVDGSEVHQVTANAERTSSGADETLSRLQGNAAGWNEL